jgi:glycosyltransferase involved in cell wall biosynthesis
MRIVIDLQSVQTENRFRGIGRYSMAFALALARNAGRHEILIVLNAALADSIPAIRHAFRGLVPDEHIRMFDVPVPVAEIDSANAWRARAAEKLREHFLRRLQPDVVLVSSMFEGLFDDAVTSIGTISEAPGTAVILYDLIPLRNQAVYLPTPASRQHYERKLESLRRAELLLAISEYSRRDAIDALSLDPDRVVNIGAAIDARFQQVTVTQEDTDALRARLGITRRMVMYAPGGFDVRKNFGNLIRAYASLPPSVRSTHQLVIVSKITDGDRATLIQTARQAGLGEDEFLVTGYVPDDELVALYRMATLFVFPSTHEGFGLPALEAMACGAPTIGSCTTSVPEVIGRADALFDPASPQSITDKMLQVLTDEDLRNRLRHHGLEHAATFSWDASARRALQEIEARGGTVFRAMDASADGNDRASLDLQLQSIADITADATPKDSDLVAVASAIAFNTGAGMNRQLLLDVSEIVQRDAKSGIQRVVRSILLELLKNAPQGYEVCPIYFDGRQFRHATAFTCRIRQQPAPADDDSIVEFNQFDIYLGLDLNAHLTHALHPVHQRLQALGVRIYFVVYDILLVQRPDWWHAGTSDVFEQWLNSITQVATGLVCISNAVANDVRAWIEANHPARSGMLTIDSFHLGADVANSLPSKGMPDDAETVLAALRARPSILTVGTIEPRKGHAQALAAFEILWAQKVDANLVIVGKEGWLVKPLIDKLRHHPELGKRLFWLEAISDEYLEKVYAASTCLLAASEGEGFGLPLIEAAQHKLPLIARDLPVFREVAGQHAFYFGGLESLDLANAVRRWLALHAENKAPQSSDMPWLTWQQSVQCLLARILPSGPST